MPITQLTAISKQGNYCKASYATVWDLYSKCHWNLRKWMKMNENEWKWMKMNENEWKWNPQKSRLHDFVRHCSVICLYAKCRRAWNEGERMKMFTGFYYVGRARKLRKKWKRLAIISNLRKYFTTKFLPAVSYLMTLYSSFGMSLHSLIAYFCGWLQSFSGPCLPSSSRSSEQAL